MPFSDKARAAFLGVTDYSSEGSRLCGSQLRAADGRTVDCNDQRGHQPGRVHTWKDLEGQVSYLWVDTKLGDPPSAVSVLECLEASFGDDWVTIAGSAGWERMDLEPLEALEPLEPGPGTPVDLTGQPAPLPL